MTVFYVRSRPTTTWAASTTYAAGNRVISTSSTNYLGIHFEASAGTTGGTEPTWNTTVGGTTADGSVTWTTRGSASIWAASATYVAGDRVVSTTGGSAAIQRLVYECTTGGTSGGSQPTFSTTIGNTTADNTVTWTTRNSTSWDNAQTEHRRLFSGASNLPANGDTIYISKNHSETSSAAVTIAYPSASSSPVIVLCVDDTGDPATPTTLAATATLITTGASNYTLSGVAYIYGVKFTAGSGASAANVYVGYANAVSSLTLDNCLLEIASTSATNNIGLGSSTATRAWVRLINTPLKFAATGQSIVYGASRLSWENTASAIQGTVPTTLFASATIYGAGSVEVKGVDLSALGAGNSVVKQATYHTGNFRFYDCRIGASAAWSTGTQSGAGSTVIAAINCDSGNGNYRVYLNTAGGVLTDETTLVMTSGASDGATPISWKIVTDANSNWQSPFVSLPLAVWNSTTGASKTATVEILRDSATNLKDDEVWVEVEYLGSASYPIATTIIDRKTGYLTTAADQTTSAVTWTTTGMANPNKQKLNVSFTPQMKGFIIARVFVAKASTTLYVNPQLTIT